MRLIDADALKEYWKRDGVSQQDYTEFHFIESIEQAPTIDPMSFVLCKDCTYYAAAKVNKNDFLICPVSGMEITANDHCSYGERR